MSPDRGRQLWLAPVLLVTVIATAIGGLLARQLYEDPEPSEPDAVLPTASSVPPAEQPGSHVVQGTPDAVGHPLYEALRDVLQVHYNAINERDYERWSEAVTSARSHSQPEARWREAYSSTEDGSILIYRIEVPRDEDTALVLVTLTSVQDPSDAPVELPVGCIYWNVVLPLVLEDDGWKIDIGPESSSPQHEPCT